MKRPSILFVDDHKLVREGLGHLFAELADVYLAGSSEEAHVLLNKIEPDLIISDVIRSGTNGFEFLDTIRGDPRTRNTPFVFLTTQDHEGARRRALMQGCDELISKTESSTFLMLRIGRLLERAAAQRKDVVTQIQKEPLRVFICYAKEDAVSAKKIWSLASRSGVNAWLDEKKLLPGHEWDTEIRSALRTSHLVIVCLSKHSISKTGYVQKEIRMVLELADEQPPGACFVVPVRIEECSVPTQLAKWQSLDLFRRAASNKLLDTLAARANVLGLLPPGSAM